MQGLKLWTMYVSEQKICIMQHYILFANINRALIHGSELTRIQEEYLRTLIKYVCENGDIATVVLQQPPFNKFTTIFKNSPKSLIDYVKLISEVIAA